MSELRPWLRMMAVGEHFMDGIAIYARTTSHPGQAVADIVLQDISSAIDQEYTPMHLSMDGARELMDSLWRAGVRPTDHRDQSALGAHLQDMRSLVEHALGMKFGK